MGKLLSFPYEAAAVADATAPETVFAPGDIGETGPSSSSLSRELAVCRESLFRVYFQSSPVYFLNLPICCKLYRTDGHFSSFNYDPGLPLPAALV